MGTLFSWHRKPSETFGYASVLLWIQLRSPCWPGATKFTCRQNSQLLIGISSDGTRFLEYREDVSKTNNGGLGHRKIVPKVTVYENQTNTERCVFHIYEKYI